MQPEKKYKDDLEYLSEIGYSKVSVTSADVDILKQKIKAKTITAQNVNGGIFFLVGVFLAEVIFFGFYNREIVFAAPPDTLEIADVVKTTEPVADLEQTLDTVEIVNENFEKGAVKILENRKQMVEVTTTQKQDTTQILQLASKTINKLEPQDKFAEKLKFAFNSPVTYLHNLKITDYRKLYFKRRLITKDVGIPAAYANSSDWQSTTTALKMQSDDYLHEEISKAMNFFRKGEYDACIYSLNTISTFNKEDVNCKFYLGMCYYYKTMYDMALINFEDCVAAANNTFYQEARYYKAMSLKALGQNNEATLILKQIAAEDDFYSVKAQETLAQLKDN